MPDRMKPAIDTGEVVVPCEFLEPTLAFFCEKLGFKLEVIGPADRPTVAVVSGYGLRLRLVGGSASFNGHLRLAGVDLDETCELIAPNGMRVELVPARSSMIVPQLEPSVVVARAAASSSWSPGRAGMMYRDLIPGRLGGRYIASQIQISGGGAVPDYVHYHRVRLQMLYVLRGWVKVVYEDQGAPFVMHPGDAVLQPPRIRHRVLECSDSLQVLELASPASHETLADHDTVLPTASIRKDRDFSGQRFVRHIAATASFERGPFDGMSRRDLGIAAATFGLASAGVVRTSGASEPSGYSIDGEIRFVYVLGGEGRFEAEGREPTQVTCGDAVTIPGGVVHRFAAPSGDFEYLEVVVPGR